MDSLSQLLQASDELEKQKLEEGRTQNGNIISSKKEENYQDIPKEKQNSEPEKYINVSITTNAHKKLKTLSSLK